MPQPNCGPLNSRSLRRTYRSGVSLGAITKAFVDFNIVWDVNVGGPP
jgi:hypothetical protein